MEPQAYHTCNPNRKLQLAMGIHIPHPRKWNHKHIILATLTGTLVVITMAAIISIILSPAHISLSIAKPTKVSKADQEDTQRYNFTLVAQNRSPHMAVVYGALSAEIWYSEMAWVPAAVVDWSPLQDGTTRQKPTNIEFSAEYWQSEQRSTPPTASSSSSGGGQSAPAASTDETDWSNCTVLVTATVWFRYRSWISTRSYDVRANCSPVNFVNGTGGTCM